VAKDIIEPNLKCISKQFKYSDIEKLLSDQSYEEFPVVDNEESMTLLGYIEKVPLEQAYKDYCVLREKLKNQNSNREDMSLLSENCSSLSNFVKVMPLQLLENTPIGEIHLLFITLRLSHVFVTRQGILVGVISRNGLKEKISAMDSKSTLLGD